MNFAPNVIIYIITNYQTTLITNDHLQKNVSTVQTWRVPSSSFRVPDEPFLPINCTYTDDIITFDDVTDVSTAT